MNRADSGDSEHRDQRLRHHRHVYDDPISLGHALGCQRPGQLGGLLLQLGIGDLPAGIGDRGIVYDGRLVSAGFDMTVNGVPASVCQPV